MKSAEDAKTLVNVLGVVYVHTKTDDGGDLYLTRFVEPYREHLRVENWYDPAWFDSRKIRLLGTSSVYRVPTRTIGGISLDLVVKNCRVGEDVPIDTHTLEEFCDAEFNSPWEEFALVMELMEGRYGPTEPTLRTQLPLAIYVPPETMQSWQSGRSRTKINRIRAKHPGIDLDILKQYKLIYGWIHGKNLKEVFEHVDLNNDEIIGHLKTLDGKAHQALNRKGYIMADMKPEHIIIDEHDVDSLLGAYSRSEEQVRELYLQINEGRYSLIDYELLLRTPEHEEEVKNCRRCSYLDDQQHRFEPTALPGHLMATEILGVPYLFGHAESTGGRLWVVGKNGHLFDYFLPERWRKTPAIRLSDSKEVFYTITKDNIHLVWETSRVGEMPAGDEDGSRDPLVKAFGINSPFEEFSIALALNRLGIPTVYVRAIYMTGTEKVEASTDRRKYSSHAGLLDPEGNPVLQENHNYITIRGYFNGPDQWVAEHGDALYTPVDLVRAVEREIVGEDMSRSLLEGVRNRLAENGYNGSSLKPNDLLLAVSDDGSVMRDAEGRPQPVVCNFEMIWQAPA